MIVVYTCISNYLCIALVSFFTLHIFLEPLLYDEM
jgi:hypothetical protein